MTCPGCGYDVADPSWETPCPECGYPRTLFAPDGDLLRRLSERRLRSIVIGLRLFEASIIYLITAVIAMLASFALLALFRVFGVSEPMVGEHGLLDWLLLAFMSVGVVMHSVSVMLISPRIDSESGVIRWLVRTGVLFAPVCTGSLLLMYAPWPEAAVLPLMLLSQGLSVGYFLSLCRWLRAIEWRTSSWSPKLNARYRRMTGWTLAILLPFAWMWWSRSPSPNDVSNDWGFLWALLCVVLIGLNAVPRVRRAAAGELNALRRGEMSPVRAFGGPALRGGN